MLKKVEIVIIKNDQNELIPTRKVTRWRVCIDFRKLNEATKKDHFSLPFSDQMLEKLYEMNIIAFLMDIQAITKFLLHQKTKRKPYLFVIMGPLHIERYLLVFAMLLLLFIYA